MLTIRDTTWADYMTLVISVMTCGVKNTDLIQ